MWRNLQENKMLIISLIIFQVIIFAGLIFMLRKIMTQNVILATKHIDELNQDYTKKDEDITRRQEELEQKADQIIRNAQEEAENLKTQSVKEVEAQKEQILKEARLKSEEMIAQAEKSRHALLSEMEVRIAKETVNKAAELIHDVLPEKFKQIVHAEWVDELIANGFKQLHNINIPKDISEIQVVSAFPFTAEQRKRLSHSLASVLDRPITLKEEIEPKLVAGLIITVASLVFDGSLKNKIKEKAR
jgi:F0F1-type ATP synthase delta subunit